MLSFLQKDGRTDLCVNHILSVLFPGSRMGLFILVYTLSPSCDQMAFICAQVARDRGKSNGQEINLFIYIRPRSMNQSHTPGTSPP